MAAHLLFLFQNFPFPSCSLTEMDQWDLAGGGPGGSSHAYALDPVKQQHGLIQNQEENACQDCCAYQTGQADATHEG